MSQKDSHNNLESSSGASHNQQTLPQCDQKLSVSPQLPLVSRGQTLLRRALSIRDDKRPREKGLVQVQYQTRSLTPSPSRGVNSVLIDIALKSNINTMGTWLNVLKGGYV